MKYWSLITNGFFAILTVFPRARIYVFIDSPNRIVQMFERFPLFVKMEVDCHAGISIVSRGKVCHWARGDTNRPQHWNIEGILIYSYKTK